MACAWEEDSAHCASLPRIGEECRLKKTHRGALRCAARIAGISRRAKISKAAKGETRNASA